MSMDPPARRRDRRHERHDRTRLEILDAAWTIARREGVAATSLREVARMVGVQPQSLYTYFPSKNALFDALFGQATGELIQIMSNVAGGIPLDRLRRGCAMFVQHCVVHEEQFLLVFQRPVPGFEPSADSMRLAHDLLTQLTTALHDAGITDPVAVDLFTAGITGLISQQISNDPGGDRWMRLLDRLITALLTA